MEINVSYTSEDNESGSKSSSQDSKKGQEDSILHHKCAVTKLVRQQMIIANSKAAERLEELKRSRFRRKIILLLGILLLLFVLWLILIFGAMIGADMCGKKSDIAHHKTCQCGAASLATNLKTTQFTSGVF